MFTQVIWAVTLIILMSTPGIAVPNTTQQRALQVDQCQAGGWGWVVYHL